MADLKYKPVPHDHKAFVARARVRKGFSEAYNALALEYQVAGQMLKARSPNPRCCGIFANTNDLHLHHRG